VSAGAPLLVHAEESGTSDQTGDVFANDNSQDKLTQDLTVELPDETSKEQNDEQIAEDTSNTEENSVVLPDAEEEDFELLHIVEKEKAEKLPYAFYVQTYPQVKEWGSTISQSELKVFLVYEGESGDEFVETKDYTIVQPVWEKGEFVSSFQVVCKGTPKVITIYGYPTAVTGVKAKGVSAYSIYLKWNEHPDAYYYRIYYSKGDNKHFKDAGISYSNELTLYQLKSRSKYYIRICAVVSTIDGSLVGTPSSDVSAITYLSTPKLKVKKSGTKTAVLTWKAVSGAKSYVIYSSKKEYSGYKKIKTIKAGKKKKFTFKKKKLGNGFHYFKVKAVGKVSGKSIKSDSSNAGYIQVYSTKTATIVKKLKAIKKKFPDGKYWNHAGKNISPGKDNSNIVTNRPCHHSSNSWVSSTCNNYLGADGVMGYQCYGYASKVSDLIFGKKAPVRSHYSFKKAKIGDHIRYNGHSVIITEKHSDHVVVTECNYGNTCIIMWGRVIYKSELDAYGAKYITRY